MTASRWGRMSNDNQIQSMRHFCHFFQNVLFPIKWMEDSLDLLFYWTNYHCFHSQEERSLHWILSTAESLSNESTCICVDPFRTRHSIPLLHRYVYQPGQEGQPEYTTICINQRWIWSEKRSYGGVVDLCVPCLPALANYWVQETPE